MQCIFDCHVLHDFSYLLWFFQVVILFRMKISVKEGSRD